MLKVFFGDYLPEQTIVAAIEERREAVQRRIEELEAIELRIVGDEREFYPRLALRRGLELNKAQLRWADETRRVLARRGRFGATTSRRRRLRARRRRDRGNG